MPTNVQSFFHQKTSDKFIFIFVHYIIIWQQLWKSESTRKQSSKQTAHIHRTNISKVTGWKVTPYQCMCNTVKLGTSKVNMKTWHMTQCISIRQGCQILVGHVTENTTNEIIRIRKSQQKFLLWYSLYYRSHRTLKAVLHYQVKYLSRFAPSCILCFMFEFLDFKIKDEIMSCDAMHKSAVWYMIYHTWSECYGHGPTRSLCPHSKLINFNIQRRKRDFLNI